MNRAHFITWINNVWYQFCYSWYFSWLSSKLYRIIGFWKHHVRLLVGNAIYIVMWFHLIFNFVSLKMNLFVNLSFCSFFLDLAKGLAIINELSFIWICLLSRCFLFGSYQHSYLFALNFKVLCVVKVVIELDSYFKLQNLKFLIASSLDELKGAWSGWEIRDPLFYFLLLCTFIDRVPYFYL